MGAHIGRLGFRLFHRVLADGGICVSNAFTNCKGDDDIDAKRSRPSIGKPGKTYAQKERVNLIGNDQRITSGPAVRRPHSKAEYMTAPERFADSQFLSCTAGAVHTCVFASSSMLVCVRPVQSRACR